MIPIVLYYNLYNRHYRGVYWGLWQTRQKTGKASISAPMTQLFPKRVASPSYRETRMNSWLQNLRFRFDNRGGNRLHKQTNNDQVAREKKEFRLRALSMVEIIIAFLIIFAS